MGNFDIGRKNRGADGDRVSLFENLVFLEGLEDIGHGRRTALGGKQIEGRVKRPAGPELLADVGRADGFAVLQHAVGHRVVVADDGVTELKQQIGGRNAQLLFGIVHGLLQKVHAGNPGALLDELVETGFEALGLGVAPEVFHVGKRALGFT